MPDFIGCIYIYSFGKVVLGECQRGHFFGVHVCIQRGWRRPGSASTLLDHQQSCLFIFLGEGRGKNNASTKK